MRTASIGIALGIILSGLSQTAQAQEYQLSNTPYCYMQLESGQIIDLTYMCGANTSDVSAQRPSFGSITSNQPRKRLQISNVKISQSIVPELIKITGVMINLTEDNQNAGSFKYQLRDRQTNRVVGISTAFVYKDIPPGGQVSFETLIEKADSGYIEPGQLQFEFLGFN